MNNIHKYNMFNIEGYIITSCLAIVVPYDNNVYMLSVKHKN